MDVLYISQFAEPGLPDANYASSAVHAEMANRNINVGVLTRKFFSKNSRYDEVEIKIGQRNTTEFNASGVTYVVPSLPLGWSARSINESDWRSAVDWGVELLRFYKPKIVHLQQWQSFWWMAEAAQTHDIPVYYTPYDFGLVCPRTVLVKSDGSKCDGSVSASECASCVYSGRGKIGKINENIVKIPIFSDAIRYLLSFNFFSKLHNRGIVVDKIEVRLDNERSRLRKLLQGTEVLIVNSRFSKRLFEQYGSVKSTAQIPWFHSLQVEKNNRTFKKLQTVGYVGRISPEKGVDVFFDAMRRVNSIVDDKIQIYVAGALNSDYASKIKDKYSDLNILWHGWIKRDDLCAFYNSIDLLVVPSRSYDNGPIAIMEAIATKTPVLISNNDTLKTYLNSIESEHEFENGSADSLSTLIMKYYENPELLSKYCAEFPEAMTLNAYVDRLIDIYHPHINGHD